MAVKNHLLSSSDVLDGCIGHRHNIDYVHVQEIDMGTNTATKTDMDTYIDTDTDMDKVTDTDTLLCKNTRALKALSNKNSKKLNFRF
jgi:hypothetical protein